LGKQLLFKKNTVTIDIDGKSIYPSFIDMYSDFGIEKIKKLKVAVKPKYMTQKTRVITGTNTSRQMPIKYLNMITQKLKSCKGWVWCCKYSHPRWYCARYRSFVALNNEDQGIRLLANQISNHFSFSRSIAFNQAYPSSLMGMMALLRQMYFDLDWYKKGIQKTQDLSLEALNKNGNLVQIFASEDKLNSLRAAKIAKSLL
jgi:hypothetical protein